jgi:hypothetical protein
MDQFWTRVLESLIGSGPVALVLAAAVWSERQRANERQAKLDRFTDAAFNSMSKGDLDGDGKPG